MDKYRSGQCDHLGEHVELCNNTIQIPECKNADRSLIWKRICGTISSLLTTTPVMFTYGRRCFSDLINKARDVAFPTIHEVLSIGSGDGFTDYYIAHKLFNADVVHLTDIQPGNDLVEELSCADAIRRYKTAGALMFTYPWRADGGYCNVTNTYTGDYIIFTGELCVLGHTNPCDLLEQLAEDFVEHIRVDIASWERASHTESLVLYKRKKPLTAGDTDPALPHSVEHCKFCAPQKGTR